LQVRKASFKNTWGLARVDGEPIKKSFYLVSTVITSSQHCCYRIVVGVEGVRVGIQGE